MKSWPARPWEKVQSNFSGISGESGCCSGGAVMATVSMSSRGTTENMVICTPYSVFQSSRCPAQPPSCRSLGQGLGQTVPKRRVYLRTQMDWNAVWVRHQRPLSALGWEARKTRCWTRGRQVPGEDRLHRGSPHLHWQYGHLCSRSQNTSTASLSLASTTTRPVPHHNLELGWCSGGREMTLSCRLHTGAL